MKRFSGMMLLAVAFLTAHTARAEEASAWEAAFPEPAGDAPQQVIHGVGAATELLYGAFFFPGAGKAARDVDLRDAEKELLQRRALKLAVENVLGRHPEYAEVMKKEARARELGYKSGTSSFTAAERAELTDLHAYLQKNRTLSIRSFLDTEAEVRRTSLLPADELRKLRGWAEDEADALKTAKKIKMKYVGDLAIGALLIADGGARLGALLTSREPGFLPAVSAARALVKPAAPKPEGERREGAQTSMSVE